MTLRSLTAADVKTAADIVTAAYGRPTPIRDIDRYLKVQPDGWLIARLEGELVGIGGITGYGGYAVIGLMATRPDFQGRGVASAVLTALLQRADHWGCPLVGLDATEAGARVYARFGFVELERTMSWRLVGSSTAPTGATGVQIVDTSSLPDVISVDAETFGTRRERVVARLIEENPERAFLVRDPVGRVSGYLVAQSSRLGPGTADGPAENECLLNAALSVGFDGPPQILLPESNRHAASVLERLGFVIERSTRHMRRGRSLALGDRTRLLGLASFGLG